MSDLTTMQFEDHVRKCFVSYVDKDREMLESSLSNNSTFSTTYDPSLANRFILKKCNF